ncbi:hypothetical protein LBMAG56_15550 [Verrucomicrobiota bacterium]|nr:hypothetical protein LBMAG56_15550 [Verrucomicrobiota bacterium]
MNPRRLLFPLAFSLSLLAQPSLAPAAPAPKKEAFHLAPAVAVEAEDFTIESGWRVVKNGGGNYMVDIIGFQHISGERLLCLDSANAGAAQLDIKVPVAGDFRLWVRYEYPPFTDTRFEVEVVQGGRSVAKKLVGAKDNERYAFGETKPRAQYDPSWGPEGLVEEVFTVPGLQAGPARIHLRGQPQPAVPGVSASRNVDLVYLTSDAQDAWLPEYHKRVNLYPILEAFRDSRGPRYEARFTNRGTKPANFGISHTYNRLPWYVNEPNLATNVAPGAASAWAGIALQDTAHFHLATFSGGGQPFDLELRPTGGVVERRATGNTTYSFYLPSYPGKYETITTQLTQLDAVLAHLKANPAVGKVPTQPLCYGGWMPLGQTNELGRKYAELYAALGMRSLHPANSGPAQIENLAKVGVPATKSWMAMSYRNPPTPENIAKVGADLAKNGLKDKFLWYDYGDEIGFSEWMGHVISSEAAKAKAAGQKTTPAEIVARLWQTWLKLERPGFNPADYWLPAWGPLDPAKLRPDSSAAAAAPAANKPLLYVDSCIFFENTAIEHVARGAADVRKALGEHVLCGANYSCHPFYYPSSVMYMKWFRGGAADLARHSEYFWQVGQLGPMINGYVVEHFAAGLRGNPKGVIRQYTMPHSPGNTDASFLRTAFSHLAHGAKMLDFFGIGMNETFTENYIDHRDKERFRSVRDVTHAIGFVEDLLPQSTVVPSRVALLVSESTERWDMAGIAADQAGHSHFGPDFRKTRMVHHLERLGIWKALTFLGSTPDLITETDVHPTLLRDYQVLIVVGDSLPPATAQLAEQWVKAGGVLLTVANTGGTDQYHRPQNVWNDLCGVGSRQTDARETFFRPRQELPFLKPHGTVAGAGWEMPQLATYERIKPAAGADVLAKFKDDNSAAFITRKLGKGQTFWCAAQPGVAYLWTALQPPAVPDRGPGTHTVPTGFDSGARAVLETVLKAAKVEPLVRCEPQQLDTRLLRANRGYILPIANFEPKVGQKATISLKVTGQIRKVSSAWHGALPLQRDGDRLLITLPALGHGDIVRLDF